MHHQSPVTSHQKKIKSYQPPAPSPQNFIKKVSLSLLAAGCWLLATSSACADDIFGEIEPPPHVEKYGGDIQSGNFGLIVFLSNIIKLFMIVAGLFGFINLILAGWEYISSSGDPEKVSSATSKITYSLIGLIVVVASFTLAGLFGYILFGDASAILSPKIYGPGID